jgi:hypothetical protein
MKKHDINLRAELYESLKKGIHKALRESSYTKTPVFTIEATDIDTDEAFEDVEYTGSIYYSEKEAIDAAREMAQDISTEDDLICVSVFAGEYETDNNDILGEPYDIFTISNKSKEETIEGRRAANYVSETVDEYV